MDVIAKIVRLATLATEGVSRLAQPIDVVVMPRAVDVFDVDIFLYITFGYRIPEIAWNVQENVKKLLDKSSEKGNHKVEHINIHISGIDFSEENK